MQSSHNEIVHFSDHIVSHIMKDDFSGDDYKGLSIAEENTHAASDV